MELSRAGRSRLSALLALYAPTDSGASLSPSALVLGPRELSELLRVVPPLPVPPPPSALGLASEERSQGQSQGQSQELDELVAADARVLAALASLIGSEIDLDRTQLAAAASSSSPDSPDLPFATVAHLTDGIAALVLRDAPTAVRLLALLGFGREALATALVAAPPPCESRAWSTSACDDAQCERLVRCAVLDASAALLPSSQAAVEGGAHTAGEQLLRCLLALGPEPVRSPVAASSLAVAARTLSCPSAGPVCLCLELVAPQTTPPAPLARSASSVPAQRPERRVPSARRVLDALRPFDCVALAFDPSSEAVALAAHAALLSAARDALKANPSQQLPPPVLLVRLGPPPSEHDSDAPLSSSSDPRLPAPLHVSELDLASARQAFLELARCGAEDRRTSAALAPVSTLARQLSRARARARGACAIGVAAAIAAGFAFGLMRVGGSRGSPLAAASVALAHARAMARRASLRLPQAWLYTRAGALEASRALFRRVEHAVSELSAAPASAQPDRSAQTAASTTSDRPAVRLRRWLTLTM